MNKPAPKEPSMDEILSSIRQIIADDDAAGKPAAPTPVSAAAKPGANSPAAPAAAPSVPPRPNGPVVPPTGTAKAGAGWQRQAEPAEEKPLALSATQIVQEEDKGPHRPRTFAEIIEADEPAGAAPRRDFDVPAELVDPDDVTFVGEEPAKPAEPAKPVFPPKNPRLEARSAPASVAAAAPMPDPKLSADMAEQLLEPATRAAIRGNLNKLSSFTSVGSITLEAMMRELLRPMLKEWLDENLPAVVERMVEKEIARISRGVE